MGKSVIFILAFLFSFTAIAQEINLVQNPGFESKTSKWTKTGASTFTIESASPIDLLYSAKWNPSATGEFLRSSTVTVPSGMRGGVCLVEMKYLWAGTSGHIVLNVDDGTNNIASLTLDPTTGSVAVRRGLNFTCPTSGTVRFELESTADAVEITFDATFLGSGRNSTQLSQATFYGSARWPGTTNCSWSRSGTSYASYTADADCTFPTVTGKVSSPAAKVPSILLTNLEPGNYFIVATGLFNKNNTDASNGCYFRLSDGTQASAAGVVFAGGATAVAPEISGTFSYATAQSSVTIEIQESSPSAIACDVNNANATLGALEFKVFKYPSQSADAITLETSGWFVDANITGGNATLGTTQATYTNVNDANFVLTNSSRATVQSFIACDGAVESGNTCSSGNESVGVSFVADTAGLYRGCVEFANVVQVTNGGIAPAFQVVETAVGSNVIVQEGGSRIQTNNNSGTTSTKFNAMHVCGNFNFSTAGRKVLKLYYESAASGSVVSSQVMADASSADGQRDIHWTVQKINQSMPTPVFTNLTSSLNAKVGADTTNVVHYGAQLTCSGTSGIGAQTGSWIQSIGNIDGNGTCAVTFVSGKFTQTPHCVMNWMPAATNGTFAGVNTPSTSAINLLCRTSANAACSNVTGQLLCTGIK